MRGDADIMAVVRASLAVATVLGLPAANAAAQVPGGAVQDPVKALVGRLDLEAYKATIKGLTQFGDRQQGTDRNRAAVDWIAAQLRSYGCDVARLSYTYEQPPSPLPRRNTAPAAAPAIRRGEVLAGVGGARMRGVVVDLPPNNDPEAQSDGRLHALNAQRPASGPREEVYCTKIGAARPDEMYIVGAHMDGRGFGEAADDDGSGTALVMELARVFSGPDVRTDRSIRFVLWNNEETGHNGARAYVAQRAALQGKEDPPGSGRYPEPKWLGMIQHDMMMFDHGMPRPDGTMSPEQRPEADVNIEFAMTSKQTEGAQKLAWAFATANDKYATDYPAQVGQHMTNTDSAPFEDVIPAISLREDERGREIGAGWDPQWHQVTDVYATYNDKDFRLGLNAAQTTLGAIATLTGAVLKK